MQKTKTKKKRWTQQQIADELGFSRNWIAKKKSEGMPVHKGPEACHKWMLERSSEGVGHKSRGKPKPKLPPINLPDPPPEPPPEDLEGEDPRNSLARAIKTERDLFALIQDAQREDIGKVPSLLRSHSNAVRARMETEGYLLEIEEKSGRLITLEAAKRIAMGAIQAILQQADGLPQNVSRKANPKEPHIAEVAIREGVRILRSRAAEAIRRIEK